MQEESDRSVQHSHNAVAPHTGQTEEVAVPSWVVPSSLAMEEVLASDEHSQDTVFAKRVDHPDSSSTLRHIRLDAGSVQEIIARASFVATTIPRQGRVEEKVGTRLSNLDIYPIGL